MEKDQLDKILELVEENNHILRSMRRSARVSSLISYLYWIIIIGSMIGTYYYVQPYIDQLLKVYQELNSSVKGIKSTADKLTSPNSMGLPPEVFQKLDSLLKNK